MKRALLAIMVGALYVLHQDIWFWRTAKPLVFGFIPIGLFYHAAYTMIVSLMMWILLQHAWPRGLEEGRGDVERGRGGERERGRDGEGEKGREREGEVGRDPRTSHPFAHSPRLPLASFRRPVTPSPPLPVASSEETDAR